jgi:hypothetical protein
VVSPELNASDRVPIASSPTFQFCPGGNDEAEASACALLHFRPDGAARGGAGAGGIFTTGADFPDVEVDGKPFEGVEKKSSFREMADEPGGVTGPGAAR